MERWGNYLLGQTEPVLSLKDGLGCSCSSSNQFQTSWTECKQVYLSGRVCVRTLFTMCAHLRACMEQWHLQHHPCWSNQTFGDHSCGPTDTYIHTPYRMHTRTHTHTSPLASQLIAGMGSRKLRLWRRLEREAGGGQFLERRREDKVENWTRCWERRRERLETVGVNRQDNSGRDGGGDWGWREARMNWSSQTAQTDNVSLSHPIKYFMTAIPRWLSAFFFIICPSIFICVYTRAPLNAKCAHMGPCPSVRVRIHRNSNNCRGLNMTLWSIYSCFFLWVCQLPNSYNSKDVPNTFE